MNTKELARLFNRIPDDIVLSVATRDLDHSCGSRCLCGWALRESIARTVQRDAAEVTFDVWSIERQLADAFGGHRDSWGYVFGGVTIASAIPKIETAWVNRLDKAVTRSLR